jgi:3-mercaptopyruvate sulfurtransferase SseA
VALLLRAKGIKRVRPLEGGLDAWRKLGYERLPVERTSVAP